MITTYEIYKLNILQYMRHGNSFNTAHTLACVGSGLSVFVVKEYKDKLKNELDSIIERLPYMNDIRTKNNVT